MNNKNLSIVVWFTGLSGAGKTTLASDLSKIIKKKKYKVLRVDGDLFRKKKKIVITSRKKIFIIIIYKS